MKISKISIPNEYINQIPQLTTNNKLKSKDSLSNDHQTRDIGVTKKTNFKVAIFKPIIKEDKGQLHQHNELISNKVINQTQYLNSKNINKDKLIETSKGENKNININNFHKASTTMMRKSSNQLFDESKELKQAEEHLNNKILSLAMEIKRNSNEDKINFRDLSRKRLSHNITSSSNKMKKEIGVDNINEETKKNNTMINNTMLFQFNNSQKGTENILSNQSEIKLTGNEKIENKRNSKSSYSLINVPFSSSLKNISKDSKYSKKSSLKDEYLLKTNKNNLFNNSRLQRLENSKNMRMVNKINYSNKPLILDERQIIKFRNLNDSFDSSDNENKEYNYQDFIPKFYILTKNSVYNILYKNYYQIFYYVILLFYNYCIISNYNNDINFKMSKINITMFLSIIFELILGINFILNYCLTSFHDHQMNKLNYNIIKIFLNNIKNKFIKMIIDGICSFPMLMSLLFIYNIKNYKENIDMNTKIILDEIVKTSLQNKFTYHIKLYYLLKLLLIYNFNSWLHYTSIIKDNNKNYLQINETKNNRYLKKTRDNIHSRELDLTIIKLFSKLIAYSILISHCMATIWLIITDRTFYDSSDDYMFSWVSITFGNYKALPNKNEKFSLYIASVYFCFTSLLTIGYGDIHPNNLLERIIVIIYLLFGCMVYSFIFAIVTSILNQNNIKIQAKQQKQNCLLKINKEYILPIRLKRNIHNVIEEFFRNWHKEKDDLFESLPNNLRNYLLFKINTQILNRIDFFKDCLRKPNLADKCICQIAREINSYKFAGDITIEKLIKINGPRLLNFEKKAFDKYNSFITQKKYNSLFKNKNMLYSNNTCICDNTYLTIDFLNQFCSKLIGCTFEKYTLLLEAGDNIEEMYFILEGSITISIDNVNDEKYLAKISKGNFYGNILMFIYHRSPYNIITSEYKNDIYILRKIDYTELYNEYREIIELFTESSFKIHYAIENKKNLALEYFDNNYPLEKFEKDYNKLQIKELNTYIETEFTNKIQKNSIISKSKTNNFHSKLMNKENLELRSQKIASNFENNINIIKINSNILELVSDLKNRSYVIKSENIHKPSLFQNHSNNVNLFKKKTIEVTSHNIFVKKPNSMSSKNIRSFPENFNNATNFNNSKENSEKESNKQINNVNYQYQVKPKEFYMSKDDISYTIITSRKSSLLDTSDLEFKKRPLSMKFVNRKKKKSNNVKRTNKNIVIKTNKRLSFKNNQQKYINFLDMRHNSKSFKENATFQTIFKYQDNLFRSFNNILDNPSSSIKLLSRKQIKKSPFINKISLNQKKYKEDGISIMENLVANGFINSINKIKFISKIPQNNITNNKLSQICNFSREIKIYIESFNFQIPKTIKNIEQFTKGTNFKYNNERRIRNQSVKIENKIMLNSKINNIEKIDAGMELINFRDFLINNNINSIYKVKSIQDKQTDEFTKINEINFKKYDILKTNLKKIKINNISKEKKINENPKISSFLKNTYDNPLIDSNKFKNKNIKNIINEIKIFNSNSEKSQNNIYQSKKYRTNYCKSSKALTYKSINEDDLNLNTIKKSEYINLLPFYNMRDKQKEISSKTNNLFISNQNVICDPYKSDELSEAILNNRNSIYRISGDINMSSVQNLLKSYINERSSKIKEERYSEAIIKRNINKLSNLYSQISSIKLD